MRFATRSRTAWGIDSDTPGDWRLSAACRAADPELFFGDTAIQVAAAKTWCRRCPVTGQCLAWAKHIDDRWGVFGGMSPGERLSADQRLVRRCKGCRVLFLPRRANVVYCGAGCRMAAQQRRAAKRTEQAVAA